MAMRKDSIFGSNGVRDATLTANDFTTGFIPGSIARADDANTFLGGNLGTNVVFGVDTYVHDSSNEIANAINGFNVSLDPNNKSQLLQVLNLLRSQGPHLVGSTDSTNTPPTDPSLVFPGAIYFGSTGSLPTTFPIAAYQYDAVTDSWVPYQYTPQLFQMIINYNNSTAYYWMANEWHVVSFGVSLDPYMLSDGSRAFTGHPDVPSKTFTPGDTYSDIKYATEAQIPPMVTYYTYSDSNPSNLGVHYTRLPTEVNIRRLDGDIVQGSWNLDLSEFTAVNPGDLILGFQIEVVS